MVDAEGKNEDGGATVDGGKRSRGREGGTEKRLEAVVKAIERAAGGNLTSKRASQNHLREDTLTGGHKGKKPVAIEKTSRFRLSISQDRVGVRWQHIVYRDGLPGLKSSTTLTSFFRRRITTPSLASLRILKNGNCAMSPERPTSIRV